MLERPICRNAGDHADDKRASAIRARAKPAQVRSAQSGVISLLAMALIAALFAGCDLPERPPIGPPQSPTSEPDVVTANDEGSGESTATAAAVESESWDLYLTAGKPVGFSHHQLRRGGADSKVLEYLVDEQREVQRGRATFIQTLSYQASELPQGELTQFSSQLQLGPLFTSTKSDMINRQLRLTTRRGLQTDTRLIPWNSTYRSPSAVDQWLRSQRMQPGDTKRIRVWLPLVQQLADVRLDCVGQATVPLFDGQFQQLLEINRIDSVDDEVVRESVLWVDDAGAILRYAVPSLEIVAYRVDADVVLAEVKPATELDATARVDVNGEIADPAEARRTAYEVGSETSSENGEPAFEIEPAPDQYVRWHDNRVWQVLYSRREETIEKGFRGYDSEVTEFDLQQSPWINYRAPAVRELVQRFQRSGVWADEQVATDATRTIHNLLSLQSRSNGFTTAAEVAKRNAGDSLGQSILLAALLRAVKIPARVSLGLRYQLGEQPVMVFHAWTVAHYDGRWHAFDATTGTPAAADRIALRTLDLRGSGPADEHQVMAEMLQQLAQMDIQIIRSSNNE